MTAADRYHGILHWTHWNYRKECCTRLQPGNRDGPSRKVRPVVRLARFSPQPYSHHSVRYVALAGGEEWCTLVAHGTWDLAVQLRAECHRKGIPLSSWWLRFFDLREVFRWFVGTSSIPTSLLSICRHLGIQLSGRLHSGIDDATTIANAMRKCVGGLLAVKISPRDPFPRPFDLVRDCAAFRAARGTVVRLETLPYDATLANILSWLNENGVPLDPPPRIHRVV